MKWFSQKEEEKIVKEDAYYTEIQHPITGQKFPLVKRVNACDINLWSRQDIEDYVLLGSRVSQSATSYEREVNLYRKDINFFRVLAGLSILPYNGCGYASIFWANRQIEEMYYEKNR